MEADRRYFLEGLFVIVLAVAMALGFVWLSKTEHRDDRLYRIRFAESVSGLALGDPVKFQGVDVGTVRAMRVDMGDPRRVEVDVGLRPGTPVRTDTRAVLRLKGLTGTVFIELSGAAPGQRDLLAVTPPGRMPEIASRKSELTIALDTLPVALTRFVEIEAQTAQVLSKFSAMESETRRVLANIGEVTEKVKEDPSLLLRGPRKKEDADKDTPRERGGPGH